MSSDPEVWLKTITVVEKVKEPVRLYRPDGKAIVIQRPAGFAPPPKLKK